MTRRLLPDADLYSELRAISSGASKMGCAFSDMKRVVEKVLENGGEIAGDVPFYGMGVEEVRGVLMYLVGASVLVRRDIAAALDGKVVEGGYVLSGRFLQ